jgi:putative peptidoglycan lipid II flippase
MSEKAKIARATGIMGAATACSRVAGLARDMVVARLFGVGFATDAFFMAYTIPNLLRQFFAEGSLTAAFVPTFSEVYVKRGVEEGRRVANICWTLLTVLMVVICLVGILASPLVVRVIGYGFGAVPGKLELTDFLNRLMFPYLFFVSLLALASGILNVLGHYFTPSFSTVLLNLAMIGCALVLGPLFQVPITALAAGVLLGGLLQLLLQLPGLRARGFLPRPDFHFGDPAVRRIARLMLPGIVGVAIYQINVVVSRLLASFLPQGSVSYLYYGQRLFEFPTGIFVVSLAQAVLPAMSRQAALDDKVGFKESLRFALVLIVLVTVPAAVGLALCAVPIYSLFFMNRTFTIQDVLQTGRVLAVYAPGLMFVGVSRVIVPTFYAMKDTRTPVKVSFVTLLVNISLGLLLMGPLKHVGLALAVSLSSMFNATVLLWLLRRRIGTLGLTRIGGSLLRILPALLAMALVVYLLLGLTDWSKPAMMVEKGMVLAAAVAVGGLVFLFSCLALGVEEVRDVVQMLRRRLTRTV